MSQLEISSMGVLVGVIIACLLMLVPFVCLIIVVRRTGHQRAWVALATLPLLLAIGAYALALLDSVLGDYSTALFMFALLIWTIVFSVFSLKKWPLQISAEEVFR